MYQLKKIRIKKNVFEDIWEWNVPAIRAKLYKTPGSSQLLGATEQLLPSERQDSLVNDLHCLPDLILIDHKWRCKPDDVAMGWLSQKPVVSKSQTHLPSIIIYRKIVTHMCSSEIHV
jgi:hypothetical protein